MALCQKYNEASPPLPKALKNKNINLNIFSKTKNEIGNKNF